ncbi:unnamed protein product [Arctia plantaginis]|uniref:Uncharacterized protein n=1 Tax=Arctia plantaginis TaxID=874455 RepID=A0A8S0YWQ4_ARCPL|nr:unnamed protein product [Arctia plantaginis]
MSRVCILLLVLLKFLPVFGYPGETIMLMPPFEVRTVDKYPVSSQFSTSRNSQRPQQKILHTNGDPPLSTSTYNNPNHETSFHDYIEDFNTIQAHTKEREALQFRADNMERNSNDSAYRAYPGPYPLLNSPGYGSTQDYRKPTSAPIAPEALIPKAASVKLGLPTLLKPVSTKMTSKVSGLLNLILALFSGSSTDGLEMNGLTDLVINGIVKPLLVAKGGIKSLMSKLTIPLISLFLINLEVLVTIWWLWEDCDTPKPSAPIRPYQKPSYNYNTYSSY